MNKGLEAFNRILKSDYFTVIFDPRTNGKAQFTCDIETVRKNLTALEILKTRVIDMHDLLVYEYSSFNQLRALKGLTPVPKEDYDLLKEVLL